MSPLTTGSMKSPQNGRGMLKRRSLWRRPSVLRRTMSTLVGSCSPLKSTQIQLWASHFPAYPLLSGLSWF